MTTSPLHGGLPTDRCTAEWWIASPRAEAIVNGQPFKRAPTEARIPVPSNIADIRTTDHKQAREIQQRVSDQFLEHFDKGLAVIGFERSAEAGTYLLGKWESN
jgi:predicted GNAT superfamily acetyltransferase